MEINRFIFAHPSIVHLSFGAQIPGFTNQEELLEKLPQQLINVSFFRYFFNSFFIIP